MEDGYMKQAVVFCVLVALVLFIVSGVFFYQAYDKYANYSNSEYSWSTQHNVYVGGDAYNYIINAGYFSAFSTLGGICVLAGMILMATALILTGMSHRLIEMERTNRLLDTIGNNVRPMPEGLSN
jgi:hypothetical protein